MRAKPVEHNPLPISNLHTSWCSILRTLKHVSPYTTKTYTPRNLSRPEKSLVTIYQFTFVMSDLCHHTIGVH